MCLCVSVYPPPKARALITNNMIWCDIVHVIGLTKFTSFSTFQLFYMTLAMP